MTAVQKSALPVHARAPAAEVATPPRRAAGEAPAHPAQADEGEPPPRGEQPPPPAPPAGGGARGGSLVVLVLIVASLAWYFASDRLTPHTSQARIQAFVVPVATEVAGTVRKVHVRNNDEVQPGQPLLDLDPTQYEIALQRSRSDYETVRLSVNAWTPTIAAARAALQAAVAGRTFAQQDAMRMEKIFAEDPGAVSVRRVENAQGSFAKARSQELAAAADLRKAQETAGEKGEKNAQLLSAKAAVEKAELDVRRTRIVAPAGGSVTDLRTDAGQFAQTGTPALTLIATHDLWISADMTENNLGNIKPGDTVAILLDVMPGELLRGRVRSVGTGIGPGKQSPPGTLPEVQNSRDWLRQAQRFPVAVEFDPAERERLRGARVGGQADVLVYTGDHPVMNWLGSVFMRVMSYLSYLY